MAESDRIKKTNPKRHARGGCSICSHPQREEIERDFVAWESPIRIAQEYGLSTRGIVYRHAHALGLFAKRDRNIRAALARIIERGLSLPQALKKHGISLDPAALRALYRNRAFKETREQVREKYLKELRGAGYELCDLTATKA